MNKTITIGIYGKSNSGKTSLILKLINYFSKSGYIVACIKISNNQIELDKPGKDTYKYSKSGSKLVVFSSKNETHFFLKKGKKEQEIIKNIRNFGIFDIIFIEGSQDPLIQKIKIGVIETRKNTFFNYTGDFNKLVNFIEDIIER
jgi:molybdopterin-guanine dinucleotide biosynthesis protein B